MKTIAPFNVNSSGWTSYTVATVCKRIIVRETTKPPTTDFLIASPTTSDGPTWAVNGTCGAGPTCHTHVWDLSSNNGSMATDGTPATCTTFTWCSPTGLSTKNDAFISVISTTGDATGCTGGTITALSCNLDVNGNGVGYGTNAGNTYSAPSWSGTAGTNNVGTAAYSEPAGGGPTCTNSIAMQGVGCR